jgi:hypothetical protein
VEINMLTVKETANILAALLYWREEMCPHGPVIMRPYFKALGFPRIKPLNAGEIVALSKRLKSGISK